MKGSIITALGVIIILAVAGLVLFRSTGEEAQAPTTTPEFTEQHGNKTDASTSSQFLEHAPSTSPASDESGSDVSSADGQPKQGTVVEINESGFSPATVTVAAGDTVTFMNNGQAVHWPMSDPAREGAQAEFDSGRGLATGETYSFTFTTAGQWVIRDHMLPEHSMTVIVK